MKLEDKIAIITGGGGGIGTCISREFTRAGTHVVVACRNLVTDSGKMISK